MRLYYKIKDMTQKLEIEYKKKVNDDEKEIRNALSSIEKTIKDIASKYVIKEIAYDRYNATQIILNLQDEGLTMVPFGQGFKDMSPPTKVILSEVLHHNIIHNNHPVLRWNFENVYVKTDAAGNLKPDKEKSTEKIDGAVAAIMAYDRATKHTESGSVYDDRGLLVI